MRRSLSRRAAIASTAQRPSPDHATRPAAPRALTALVVAGHGRHYVIETGDGLRLRAHPRGKRSECVVGDRVQWLPASAGEHAEGVIVGLEARRNLLHRQDAWRSKSFAANLDQLLFVLSAHPMFSESQLGRALIAAEAAGIPVVIVLNKTDRPETPAAQMRLQPYRDMGVTVLALSLRQDPEASRAQLLAAIQGKTSLVMGPSGSGKSTLINQLVPQAAAAVGEVSEALQSGRHTTTHSTLYWLDADRHTALIDSPGFQEFGLGHIPAADLARLMPDLRDLPQPCRFANCTHREEPDCAVTAALRAGAIAPSRYALYRQVLEELGRQPAW